jgi:methyl-accepting chemotaxis protein
MVYRHLRLKINFILTVVATTFVSLLWFFNTEIVYHDWARAIREFPMLFTIVVILMTVACIILYFLLTPLVRCLKKIEQGESAEQNGRLGAFQSMVRLPLVIIMVSVIGFFLGPIGTILPRTLVYGEPFFAANNMLTIFYSMTIGFVCSLTIIMLCNIVLSSAKRILNVRKEEELQGSRIRDLSLRAKNILYPFGLALMFAAMMGVAGFSMYDREMKDSRSLYQDLSSNKALTATENGQVKNLRLLLDGQAGGESKKTAAQELSGVMENRENTFLVTAGILFFALLFIILGLAIFFSSETSSYLRKFSRSLKDVLEGEGDLSKRMYVAQFNELGELSILFNRIIEMLYSLLKNVTTSAQDAAASSVVLNQFIESFSGSVGKIASGFEKVENNISAQGDAVNRTNQAVAGILASIEEVRENVEIQASFIEQSSASITQMSTSISNVATTTQEAQRRSDILVTLAKDGEEKVENTILAIEGVEKTSKLVNEIVEVISRIASQTNLLAMNASIEASHAGIYGKGFSVVADEVRKLAEESAESTKQISHEIDEMTHSIANGVELSRRTAESLNKISQDINLTSKVMTTISEAMNEQNEGTKEIIGSVGSILQTTAKIKERTADQFAKSTEIRERMNVLVASSADIRGVVDSQAENIRKALELIENVKTVTKNNQHIVEEFEKAVGKFKLQ